MNTDIHIRKKINVCQSLLPVTFAFDNGSYMPVILGIYLFETLQAIFSVFETFSFLKSVNGQ